MTGVQTCALPISSAVVADIADIARGVRSAPFGMPTASLAQVERLPMQRHEGGYYIRLSVHDRPGAAAAIATRMAEKQISLESIVQRGRLKRGAAAGGPVPVILLTYATTEALIREALAKVVASSRILSDSSLVLWSMPNAPSPEKDSAISPFSISVIMPNS